jgi:hypothetical protein
MISTDSSNLFRQLVRQVRALGEVAGLKATTVQTWVRGVAIAAMSLTVTTCGLTPKHTEQLNQYVRYEAGVEKLASLIDESLADAIAQIESYHQHQFKTNPEIFVFASNQSFEAKTGYNAERVAGLSLPHGVFLAPQLEKPLIAVMTHELSHVLLRQWIGSYRFYRIPIWFREGMATRAAHGGGAQAIDRETALQEIYRGHTFSPNETEGLVIRKDASYWGLNHHMFYRQGELFVEFLATRDSSRWAQFLFQLHRGVEFSTAWDSAYDESIQDLWVLFVSGISPLP